MERLAYSQALLCSEGTQHSLAATQLFKLIASLSERLES